MNFQTVAALVAAAVATATSVNAQGAPCDTSVLAGLVSSDNVNKCSTNSGYSFTSLASPTSAQVATMCADQSCLSALSELQALNLGDCTVAGFAVMTDLIDPIVASCASSGAATATSSGSGAAAPAVGEASTAGSDNTVEVTTTSAPATSASSGSVASAAASAASASASGSVGSSGSNSGAVVAASSALVGSVVLAAAMMA